MRQKNGNCFVECSVSNKGRYLRRGKRPFAGSVLFPLLNLSRRNPQGEDGTPPLFSKPFPGIYLFALQIDKCHSSFKKVPIQKLIIKLFTDLPVLGTELYKKVGITSISRNKSNSGESFWKMGCGKRVIGFRLLPAGCAVTSWERGK